LKLIFQAKDYSIFEAREVWSIFLWTWYVICTTTWDKY